MLTLCKETTLNKLSYTQSDNDAIQTALDTTVVLAPVASPVIAEMQPGPETQKPLGEAGSSSTQVEQGKHQRNNNKETQTATSLAPLLNPKGQTPITETHDTSQPGL